MALSGRIRDELKARLETQMGFLLVDAHDRYLGLPAIAGRSRSDLFHNIRGRFWGKINWWNEKLLLRLGKAC
ncbi:UNVERIFIED_CONTAM: hypothetical protein Slati_3638700, partial [Sesamum latifolium]